MRNLQCSQGNRARVQEPGIWPVRKPVSPRAARFWAFSQRIITHGKRRIVGTLSGNISHGRVSPRTTMEWRQRWYKSAQNAHGNLWLNSAESKSYSAFFRKTPHPPVFARGRVAFRRRRLHFEFMQSP